MLDRMEVKVFFPNFSQVFSEKVRKANPQLSLLKPNKYPSFYMVASVLHLVKHSRNAESRKGEKSALSL